MSLNGNSLGMLLGSIIHDPKSGGPITTVILMPLMLFSGYFKNRDNLPVWVGWIEYLSPIKYGLIALLNNETQYKPSRIGELNFDVGMWTSVGVLVVLIVSFKLLSLFFLWILKTKLE